MRNQNNILQTQNHILTKPESYFGKLIGIQNYFLANQKIVFWQIQNNILINKGSHHNKINVYFWALPELPNL